MLVHVHRVVWCLLNEEIRHLSQSREEVLASQTAMRWKVLSQQLHRASFLLNLGMLFIACSWTSHPLQPFQQHFSQFQAHLNTTQLYLLLHSCFIRSTMWYFASPYEHIPRSSYWLFIFLMLHDRRCFIQEHISHWDIWKQKTCPTFWSLLLLLTHASEQVPTPLSYRETLSLYS